MEIVEIITVYFLSMLKFLFGITGGYLAEWNMFFTMFITAAGMMSSVVIFSYFGTWLRHRVFRKLWRKNRKVFTRQNRRKVMIWNKYGIIGVAFFTPILLMPIPGTLLAVGFGCNRRRLIMAMSVSAVIWSIIQTWLFYTFWDILAPVFA